METPDIGPIRLVLAAGVDAEMVEDAALDLDWLLAAHWPASKQRPYEDQYVGIDEETTISYLDDDLVDLRYLVIRGPLASALADAASTMLPIRSASDALADLERSFAAGAPASALPAALLSARADDRGAAVALAIRAAADDPDAQSVLVLLATYLDWPELWAEVRELAERATDADVRREAAVAAGVLRGLNEPASTTAETAAESREGTP